MAVWVSECIYHHCVWEVAPESGYSEGMPVFGSDRDAYEYSLEASAAGSAVSRFPGRLRDLLRVQVGGELFRRVREASDEHEYEMMRQGWDGVNRPK